MIEYHGWININENLTGEDENIDEILTLIKNLFTSAVETNQFFTIRQMNYSNILHFAGAHNHRGRRFEEFLMLFRQVGTIAKGSYGLLYVWDDEDSQNGNQFIVYVMTQGTVEMRVDNLLSPCNPKIDA